jgi:hypothetical protein
VFAEGGLSSEALVPMNKTVGACLAMSVATLFAAACDENGGGTSTPGGAEPGKAENKAAGGVPKAHVSGTADKAKVPCLGIHECKGKSACHVIGGHACAGQNACKGKGWIEVPAAECEAKGGKVLDS